MKLKYNPTRTITTADLYNACDPPLVFKVKVRPGRTWAKLDRDFEGAATEVETAKKLVSMVFLSVSDGENTYPLKTISQVEDLQQAIEELNPGGGDEFISAIAWGFSNNHYNYLAAHLGN